MIRRKYRKKDSRTNPYFRTTEKVKVTASFVIYIVLALTIMSALIYLINAPFFRVEVGEVVGGSETANKEVKELVAERISLKKWWFIPLNNRFFFSADNLEAEILSVYSLNSANITVNARVVDVVISEKVSTFYLIKDDVMFAIDRAGSVLGVVDDIDRARIIVEHSSGNSAPLIYDNRTGSLGDGVTALPEEWLENIVQLFEKIQLETMLTPTVANLSDEDGRVDIETDAGVTLYLTLKRPIDQQIDKLQSLIDKKLVDVTSLSYIDLRFTNRLFYH